MRFKFNDGGRAAAGYKGQTGDCVTRSIAIAANLPYQQVYEAMAQGNATQRKTKRSGRATGKRTAASGILTRRKWFKDYMAALGWKWTPTMGIGTGCTVHLRADELPSGRLIVAVSKHYTAVIDGVIHDTFDPSERGATIYPPGCAVPIPKGAVGRSDGSYVYSPERCVYGYWSRA